MANPVTPLPEAHCIGTHVDGTVDLQLKCEKGLDGNGNPIYTCATWRYFLVNCPKVNQLCSNLSGAYVAASVVCNQRLF